MGWYAGSSYSIAFIGLLLSVPVHTYNSTLYESNEITGRQNPFLQWLTGVIGVRPITTTIAPHTTTHKPTTTTKQCKLKCVCGIPNKKRRIVGGQETQVNQYPWVAMLVYSGKFYCGATLISDRYVITAAHCLNGFNPGFVTVRLLEHDRSKPSPDRIDRKIKKVIQHSRYNTSNYNNDIALILLDQPIEFNDIIRPVCLPTQGKSFTGEVGVVMGWGATMEYGVTSDTLHEVTVPILSNSECKRTQYGPIRITDNMICAGYHEGEKDSCQGDSGGPMHVVNDGVQHEIVGIISWGEGCAQPKYPGVYTRVNRYLTWIRSNTPDACYC